MPGQPTRNKLPDPIVLGDGSTIDPSDGDYNWTKPSKQWEAMSDDLKKRVNDKLHAIGINAVILNWEDVDGFLSQDQRNETGGFRQEYQNVFSAISQDPELLLYSIRFFPKIKFLYEKWLAYMQKIKAAEDKAAVETGSNPNVSFEAYMSTFTNNKEIHFLWHEGSINTQAKLGAWLEENSREDTPPAETNAMGLDLRLGGSRFFVPPISIQVNQAFRAGSLTGSALRQQNSPKFNSGHSDTTISMTLYFPNQESIWGTSALEQDINFDKDSDEVIDGFLSSLRGLVAQFRYSPILPIRNVYLNRTYGITAVCLQNLTIQTMPKYPFCLAVTIELTSFNHKVFLPMLNDFNQAIRWGRFRQYIGRAAQKMNSYVNMGFLVETESSVATDGPGDTQSDRVIEYDGNPSSTFSKLRDLDTTMIDFNPNKFQLYYPNQTPAKVFGPDTSTWRQYGEDSSVQVSSDLWSQFLGTLGYDVQDNPEAIYDYLKNFDQQNSANFAKGVNETDLLMEYLRVVNTEVAGMTESALSRYLEKRIPEREAEFAPHPYTDLQREQDIEAIRIAWFSLMFNRAATSPRFKDYINQEKARRQTYIKEWEVPMSKLDMDWDKIIVQGVSVSMGNNFARLQLQMQSEPVFQHIGGRDSTINVSMIILGEDELIRFQRLFDHVNGLARLEHSHGILGFLGIKNVITTLCGMKYVLPLGFETSTIPNYPHAYSVNMTLVDFDIFQQKREELSSEQQKEFIVAFGTKRNPFLRVKQLWGAFNAYPDFPLAVFEEEIPTWEEASQGIKKQGKLIGHLDPDFYFRSFETIDDDLVQHNLETRPSFQSQLVVDSETGQIVSWGPGQPVDGVPATSADGIGSYFPGGANSPSSKSVADRIYAADALEMKVYFPVCGENQDKMSGCIIKKGDIALANVDTKTGAFNVLGSADDNAKGGGFGPVLENHAGHTLDKPVIGTGQPGDPVPFSSYGNPTIEKKGKSVGKNDPAYHVEQMMYDAQYRNKSGRMIRAYPTFMLWLIDEGGHFAGVKLFDNFYGLQSVIDFSLHQSEDILGDTLVLRLSNLYSKLNTPYTKIARVNPDGTTTASGSSAIDENNNIQDYLSDPSNIDEAIDNMLINKASIGYDNLLSGTQDTFIRELNGIRLKPGVRVHLRMGYSANPNSLQTVFNGTITEVALGEIVEVTAQSDSIELAPYVNTTDKNGDSGKVDGAFSTGLWMSEPRDLMVRLLSMGSSTFRESVANATAGMIFSENKFGIRHFGQILYEPLSEGEFKRHDMTNEAVNAVQQKSTNLGTGTSGNLSEHVTEVRGASFDAVSGTDANVRGGVLPLMNMLWANSFRHRDYELFKRNIYPGNGSGVAQYLGGDFPEAGLMMAEAAGSDGSAPLITISAEAQKIRGIDRAKAGQSDSGTDAAKKEGATQSNDPIQQAADEKRKKQNGENGDGTSPVAIVPGAGTAWDLFSKVVNGNLDQNPLFRAMGIVNDGDDDLKGFDEVSFRAQTYMKSVWDLFQLCAALLPNYVVAVRPFEDRSTVFYGKPHWLYTSGVVPVTDGIPKKSKMDQIKPDSQESEILRKIASQANPLSDFKSQQELLSSLNKVTPVNPSPTGSTGGIPWKGGDVKSLPGEIGSDGHKAVLPIRQGTTGMEMHLPTSTNLEEDKKQHKQLDSLPARLRHPFYMDRQGGGRGGYTGINSTGDPDPNTQTVLNESAQLPGQPGAAGILKPEEEQWYFNMRWPFTDYWHEGTYRPDTKAADYFGKRVAIQSAETNKIVIACIGESGPAVSTGKVAGLSPDVWVSLGLDKAKDSTCFFGFVEDQNTALGPVDNSAATSSSSSSSGGGIGSFLPGGSKGPGATTPAAPAPTTPGTTTTTPDAPSSTTPSAEQQVTSLDEKGILELVNKGADPVGAQSYVRGYLNASYNIWAVQGMEQSDIAYKRDKDDPNKAAEAYKQDPVGHFARLLFDTEYATRFKNFKTEGKVGAEALLGQDNPNLAGVFSKGLGQLEWFSGPPGRDKPAPESGDVLAVSEAIWDQFRDQWRIRDDGKYPEIIQMIKDSDWNKSVDFLLAGNKVTKDRGLDRTLDKYKLMDKEYWEGAAKDPNEGKSIYKDYDDEYYDYLPTALVGGFKRFMWQNPYCRAWLVVTTNFHTSVVGSPGSFISGLVQKASSVAAQTAANAGGVAGAATRIVLGDEGMAKLTDWVGSDELCDFGNSSVKDAFAEYLRLTYDYEFREDKDHKDDKVGWESIGQRGPDGSLTKAGEAMLKWLEAHDAPGMKSVDPIDRLKEQLSATFDGTIGHLLSVAGNTLQGLISAFRLQMLQLSLGLDMVGNMQRQAHILNKVLNDSIYYAEGSVDSEGNPDLLRSVDNPFTREYGEPVVEIREPFQRLHYKDSWQHILNNGIQETLNGVSTVVTASSDGKYPVSVYFDKGAPTNLQNEKAVETGLFWDNAKGEGFFSFLHPLIHPIESIRGYTKIAQGSSDELLSKRVALWHLKESLKDIYSGEIIVLGDPDIRPHDLVYIADVYERMYGMVEVEAVTHHFTAEDGFITCIVPNAVVTVNDPSRWTITNWLSALWGTKNIRDDTRNYMQVFADDTSGIKTKEWVTTADLAQALRTPILGHTTFTGGASAVTKDLISAKATGFLATEADRTKLFKQAQQAGENKGNDMGTTNPLNNDANIQEANMQALSNLPGISLVADIGWDIWDWVKDNLMDQHGCYIQYLTRDGQPMDAGLSYAQGVAVGRFHTVELLPNILGLSTNVAVDGHARITVNDMLSSLGWHEVDVAKQYKELSWWVAQTNSRIVDTVGLGPDSHSLDSAYVVNLVQVTKVEDGDTIHGRIISGDYTDPSNASPATVNEEIAFRFAGVRVFELANHDNPDYVPEDDPGRRAQAYLESICPKGTIVAIRQVKGKEREFWGRQLGVIYANVPESVVDIDERKRLLMQYAGRKATESGWEPANISAQPWDGYLDDGQPYTLNWQMIMAGYGDVDLKSVADNNEDRGVIFGAGN